MSASLQWRPLRQELPDISHLKDIFIKANYISNEKPNCNITCDDISFITGVKLGTNDKNITKACDILLAAIAKYKEVELMLSW